MSTVDVVSSTAKLTALWEDTASTFFQASGYAISISKRRMMSQRRTLSTTAKFRARCVPMCV